MNFHTHPEPELEILTVTVCSPPNSKPLKVAEVIRNISELSGVSQNRISVAIGRSNLLDRIEISAPRRDHPRVLASILNKTMNGLHRIVAYY